MPTLLRPAAVALAAIMLAACGAISSPGTSPTPSPSASVTPSLSPSATPTPSASPTPTPTPLTTVAVYFIRDQKISVAHRDVARGDAVGALAALMAGPSATERALGLSTSIPSGTQFLYVSWDGLYATVNLSHQFASGGGSFSMSARLAQVVFTVTQFAPIKYVSFQLDGKPVTVFGGEGIVLDHPVARSNYEQLSPAILIETPALGETVSGPITVKGTANTYEAVFQLQLLRSDGQVAVTQTVHATSGTGTRGTFSAMMSPPSDLHGAAILRAFEYSAKDGLPINVVDIPIVVA